MVKELLKQEYNVTVFSRTFEDAPESDLFKHVQFDASSDEFPIDQCPECVDGAVYLPGSITLKPFHLLKKEDFMQDWNINVGNCLPILQALRKPLKKSESASVVLYSTVAVQTGMPFHSSIAMAKGAIEGLTRALAAEWAPSIRVNAIAPSLVETPLAAPITKNEKAMESTLSKHPLKRIGSEADVAKLAHFLLTENSSWMTGQITTIDGGLSSLRL